MSFVLPSSRTAVQLNAARRLHKLPPGPFVHVELDQHPNSPAWMTSCYRNNCYTVMIQDAITDPFFGHACTKALIQRHDAMPIPYHWSELMTIKDTLFGKEALAWEFYPLLSKLQNDANIYWLYILIQKSSY